ncbi:hypothetical protein BDV95DRAFT_38949 [Massariosphaeria phaeospora]|uniref:F-box domain-containing protein n=1 Tax=Massariosphaeria phaeospora TaxID=100035 RepID=A0A7C8I6V2_9PLEO|nr:hypothetical protein BDV95DRAFT_38949 [Massariosphaeria phaeospora]
MARIPRRNHSVSGPPSAHCVLKDVACCCNMAQIHQFYMAMMALRRNPLRKCKIEDMTTDVVENAEVKMSDSRVERLEPPTKVLRAILRNPPPIALTTTEPFRFFDLPREIRDHVYSYLVVRRGKKKSIIEAKEILRGQKKRATAQRTRERLNQKRVQNGRAPVSLRDAVTEPIVRLSVLQASKLLHYEASDCLYQSNWFAVCLDNFPVTRLDTPLGWNFSQITKLQLELQLKDAQRMNSYIDWATFFAAFPSLRFLRIIPTFHPRYYDWARTELQDWDTAHYIQRAFFRELLAAVPENLDLKLGPSLDSGDDMTLEGKSPVSKRVLLHMYAELGMRRDVGGSGGYIAVDRIVDCGERA